MPDKISEVIIGLAKRVDNLESQRGLNTPIVDRFNLFFEDVTEVDSTHINTTVIPNGGDILAVTDTFLPPEYGVDFSETAIKTGNHTEAGFLRLDYGQLDIDRLSFYQGGAQSEVIVTLT